MEKANKNTHLNHLEDNIFLGLIDGTREAINFIRDFRDVLKGHADRPSGGTSVKWDGAPAIWAGPHPESGKFFVAKKTFKKILSFVSLVFDLFPFLQNQSFLQAAVEKKISSLLSLESQ